ncbi:MAG: adenylate/guanylate cyclase domain-containing protein [Actinomycetota bacterium]
MSIPERFARLTVLGCLPGDSDDVRLRKSTLTLAALTIIPLASVWVIVYFALGLPVSAAIPFGYQLFAGVSLAHFLVTKRYRFFRFTQLLLMLLLPFFLQWSLGGFIASSAVMLWALISPFGALMFVGTRQAIPWFVAYLVLAGVSVLIEPLLPAGQIPPGVVISFFGLNVGAVSFTAYLLLQYFVRQRERAMAALDAKHRELVAEQERSERLLLNILPGPIATRLKHGEGLIADAFDDVTVLFADIVDFSEFAAITPPEQVVAMLNDIFSEFDRLADERGLEKIKTIGDAYMVVGGLPMPRPGHAEAVADMAVAMRSSVATRSGGQHPLHIRIGIHTGPVVAGVIGTKKFSYDLWGDTVNTASRMESHGVVGEIQVTAQTYARLKDDYTFVVRENLSVKGKGVMTTYLLGERPASPSSSARGDPATHQGTT